MINQSDMLSPSAKLFLPCTVSTRGHHDTDWAEEPQAAHNFELLSASQHPPRCPSRAKALLRIARPNSGRTQKAIRSRASAVAKQAGASFAVACLLSWVCQRVCPALKAPHSLQPTGHETIMIAHLVATAQQGTAHVFCAAHAAA
jgi:hypothetical protein